MNIVVMTLAFLVPLLVISLSIYFLRAKGGLSAEREQSEVFFVNLERVSCAIRAALSERQRGYKFVHIIESTEQRKFDATILPTIWPLLLSTRISVTIAPTDGDATADQIKVIVHTTPQPYITGDVFDFYGGYIRDILRAIRAKLVLHP